MSIFFQISRTDFLEAARIYNTNEYGLRIVTYQNGVENFVYLPEVNLHGLSVLVSILRASIVSRIQNISELRRYIYTNIY